MTNTSTNSIAPKFQPNLKNFSFPPPESGLLKKQIFEKVFCVSVESVRQLNDSKVKIPPPSECLDNWNNVSNDGKYGPSFDYLYDFQRKEILDSISEIQQKTISLLKK
ncbi:hypothetical protein [Holospora undulata]|uniref:Uncharacterized protein n=1 Tax=Holospora undulata HU1 TaxID=1321371 RepID=A0A061JHK2_9PROT|nr:hypothetical protein [Holospora undulata]ETZ04912.1 hypothetical protein K737_300654 [Holospora undulata HU1]